MEQEQRISETCPAGSPAPSAASADASPRCAGGAPAHNRNRTTHAIFGLGLPRGTSHIAERLNRLRRELARLVEERRGEVSLYHAAVIDAAVKWERLGQLAGRWLRKEGDKLSPQEKLGFAKEIARAAVERNRVMVALKLDRDEELSVWDRLDLSAVSQDAPQPVIREIAVSPNTSVEPTADRSPNVALERLADDATDSQTLA